MARTFPFLYTCTITYPLPQVFGIDLAEHLRFAVSNLSTIWRLGYMGMETLMDGVSVWSF
jgi:hypothetical protein